MTRTAQCFCGQLRAFAEGEPARISVCHCLNCKLRSGSAFSYNATFAEAQVRLEGEYRDFSRASDSGRRCTNHFCPVCGSVVAYEIEARPGMISIPAGAFQDPEFPAPTVEVYEERRNSWCSLDIK